MKSLIPWEDKPATVTTATFKRIKDYVLSLKETESERQTIVTPDELRERLEATDADWHFTDDEMLTAVGHLENYGYVKRLRTSKGEVRILLEPERLNNLASSFVLEARRNPKGLGALEEKRLLAGGYDFPELRDLDHADRDVLLDSAALLFLEHNVCFRETDPLRMEPYLVFPELINLKKLPEKDAATEDGAAYTVTVQLKTYSHRWWCCWATPTPSRARRSGRTTRATRWAKGWCADFGRKPNAMANWTSCSALRLTWASRFGRSFKDCSRVFWRGGI